MKINRIFRDSRDKTSSGPRTSHRAARTRRLSSSRAFSLRALVGLAAAMATYQMLPGLAYIASGNSSSGRTTPAGAPMATRGMAKKARPAGRPAVQSSDLQFGRFGHTATRLADGRVLIAGGQDESGPLAVSEIFDPATRTFSIGGALIEPRAYHTATALPDGRVLIAGGASGDRLLNSTEIFDPVTESFIAGPNLINSRAGHTATLLADGRLLVVGGDTEGSAEMLSPVTGQFAPVPGALVVPRQYHSAVLLQSGKILVAGGQAPKGVIETAASLSPKLTGEIFDPATMGFSLTSKPMRGERVRPLLNLLSDGKVQVIGGDHESTIEIFNPAGDYFTAYTQLADSAEVTATAARAAFIHSGADATIGGGQPNEKPLTKEAFDRSDYTLTDLPDAGFALVAAGKDTKDHAMNTAVSPPSSSAAITTDRTDYEPGKVVTITGSGWQPGENVTVHISESVTSPNRAVHAHADVSGNITNSKFKVPETNGAVTFTLSAKGARSHRSALTIITDALNPGNEAISTFASNCTTSQSNFNLGDSICVTITGAWIPSPGDPQDKLQVVDPGGNVRNDATGCLTTTPTGPAIGTDPENFSFTFPSTMTTVCGSNTYQNVGEWTIEVAHISDSSVAVKAFVTLSNPNVCSGVVCPVQLRVPNDPGQCGANVNLDVTPLGPCTVVLTDQNNVVRHSGDFFPVGTTTITATPSVGPSCSFGVVVLDTTGPKLTCPANVVQTTSGTSAIVTYPAPTAVPSCPGPVTVTSVPASGSTFPAGTTTVTTTAKDSLGNTSTCTFTVTVIGGINTCIKDNTTGDYLQWSSTSGVYLFTTCGSGGTTVTGTGTVSTVNGTRTLTVNTPNLQIKASFLTGQLTGTATITVISSPGLSQTFRLNQTVPNATCGCSPPA
jgi:hypothetical protein